VPCLRQLAEARTEGAGGRIRFACFEDAAHGGTSLEMVPMRKPGIEKIRADAADWDGSEPVRGYRMS